MYTRQRYGTELQPLELRLEGGWVLAGRPVAELKAQDLEAEILAFLADQTEPLDAKTIQTTVTKNRQYVMRKLNDMTAAGKVKRTGTGKRGNPYRYAVPVFGSSSVTIYDGTGTESETGEQAEFFPYHEPTFARPI